MVDALAQHPGAFAVHDAYLFPVRFPHLVEIAVGLRDSLLGIEAAQVKLRSHRHAAGAVDFRPADVFGNRRLQRGFAGFAQAAHFQGHGDIPDQHPHFLAAVGGIEQFSLLIERFDPYDIPRI